MTVKLMKKRNLSDSILECLRKASAAGLSSTEIAERIGLKGKNRKQAQKSLHWLVKTGTVIKLGDDTYAAVRTQSRTAGGKRRGGEAASEDRGGRLVTGTLDIARSGDGFLSVPGNDEDIRISKRDLGCALPGDTVEALVQAGGRKGGDGGKSRGGSCRVVRILKRGRDEIVGTLKTTGRFFYVVALDPAYSQWFEVRDAKGGRLDDRVVVKLVSWDRADRNPVAEIVEVLGPSRKASLDTIAIMRQYGFDDGFPADVEADAARAEERMKNPGERMDLRKRFIFTIDPVNAKDFDDAISLEDDREGGKILGVHIADVAHFVRPGGALDREAHRRGNSVYLPDKVIPMLPARLSDNICSLKPHVDRLTFSVFIKTDRDGAPVSTSFARTIIRSGMRLTYEQAMEALNVPEGAGCPKSGLSPDRVKLLKDVAALAMKFRAGRFARHALDLDLPEYEVVLRDDGTVADIRQVKYDLSHQMIEECMVAANEAVDEALSRQGIPLIHRIHEPPPEDKLEELSVKLEEMGLSPSDLRQQRNIARILESVKDGPLAALAKVAVLRSMCKAVYSASPKGHYGLSKKYYAHFTSPIRRYPDLIVHRILAASLLNSPSPYDFRKLGEAAWHCSETEQKAAEAERALIEIKKYRLLEQELRSGRPPERRAVVVKTMPFGLFVELDELQVQGLVRITAQKTGRERVRHDKGRDVLRAGRRLFKSGAVIQVRVAGVDFEKRRLDFVLIPAADGHHGRSQSDHVKNRMGKKRRRQ